MQHLPIAQNKKITNLRLSSTAQNSEYFTNINPTVLQLEQLDRHDKSVRVFFSYISCNKCTISYILSVKLHIYFESSSHNSKCQDFVLVGQMSHGYIDRYLCCECICFLPGPFYQTRVIYRNTITIIILNESSPVLVPDQSTDLPSHFLP